jgi:hypothetical protein
MSRGPVLGKRSSAYNLDAHCTNTRASSVQRRELCYGNVRGAILGLQYHLSGWLRVRDNGIMGMLQIVSNSDRAQFVRVWEERGKDPMY